MPSVNILDAERYNWPPGSPDGTFLAGMNGDVLALVVADQWPDPRGRQFHLRQRRSRKWRRPAERRRLAGQRRLPATVYAGANGAVQAVVCQTDGRVVIGGAFTSADGIARNNIARLMTDGSLDTSFNPGPGADAPGLCRWRKPYQWRERDLRRRRVQHHQRRRQPQPCAPHHGWF